MGYFYFVESNGKVVAIARINNASGSVSPFGAANVDEIQWAKIIDQLATFDQVKGGSYEVRLLAIPTPNVYYRQTFNVLWLKSDPGGTDLIYQLPNSGLLSSPYGEKPGTFYKADDFLKMIRPATEQLDKT